MTVPPLAPGSRGAAGTPRRTGSALDDLIRRLEAEYRLGLQVRDHTWSPSQNKSLADIVVGQIKRCYFSSEPALRQSLQDFKSKSPESLAPKARLELLHLLLRSQTPKPARSQTLRDDTHKSLRDQTSRQVPQSPRAFQILRDDEPESAYTTAPTGSPKDGEGEWEAYGPPSPTASIRSAVKRSQASPQISLGLKGRKRPSQSSEEDGNSPKLTKFSKGKQSSENKPLPSNIQFQEPKKKPVFTKPSPFIKPSVFKKPSLDMARSFQPTFNQTSANTSFNASSKASFNSTAQWSSQESATQPNTTMTSFNSELAGFRSSPKYTRTSSTTMGSLDDQDFDEVAEKLNQEQIRNSTRESTSTYGSIDEEAMQLVSAGHEMKIERNVTRSPTKRPVPMPLPKVPTESPTKMSHWNSKLPHQNIFVDDITAELKKFPYFILFICHRIAAEHGVSLQDLMDGMDGRIVASDRDAFWAKIDSHPKVPPSSGGRESEKVWLAAQGQNELDGYTFKGIVTFNTNKRTMQVFQVKFQPLQVEKSCRFQRKFGTDRFLYLSFPTIENGRESRELSKDELGHVQTKWMEWLQTEHSFIGRKWRVFHVEPVKRGKTRVADGGGTRAILFATEGMGIDKPCLVGDMLNWFFPFRENLHQSICKAFARLDLGISRTVPTLVFKPSRVRYVKDIEADGTPEDTQFDDPSLHWEEVEDKATVMNDGCSLISLGAAKEVWRIFKKKTGINERMPTAFQARIGGSKGLWVVSSGLEDDAPPPMGINISASQLKFNPHPEDKSDRTFDDIRLTFELVNYSMSPSPSDLHISFISIMIDRGVPRTVIENIMKDRLDIERDQLLEMLDDSARMYEWVHKECTSTQDMDEMLWQAALPSVLGNRIKLLLESGFQCKEEPYLGICLSRMIKQQQVWEEQKLRVPLGKSTFLYGIADPLGVLAPGEFHVQFSTWFDDDTTDESYLCLDEVNVLIARQPACRRSDLQKVRAISHSKLSHLTDVVVLPSRGEYPLAGKLQGGDYDGDIFWLCWEAALVDPFKNAPAPVQALDPSRYGIKTFTKKLRDVITPYAQSLSSVDDFLREAINFRLAESLLGKVSNYLEKQVYAENRVYSKKLDALCDMHDLLVDAPKQGYVFTDAEFTVAKKKLGLPRQPIMPAYKAAMEACLNAKEMGVADENRQKDWKEDEKNAIDYLYFRVVRKHNIETLRLVENELSKKLCDDPDLQHPYLYELTKQDPVIERELKSLVKGFEAIRMKWNSGVMNDGGSTGADQYNITVDACYMMFRKLQPQQLDPTISSWTEPYLWRNVTKWEYIRASALYAEYPKKSALVFHMAGKELTDLKCPPSRTSRGVCRPIYAIMKPRITKVAKEFEEVDSDEEDLQTQIGDD